MHLCLGRGEDSNGGKPLSIFWEELDELSVAFCRRERGSKQTQDEGQKAVFFDWMQPTCKLVHTVKAMIGQTKTGSVGQCGSDLEKQEG